MATLQKRASNRKATIIIPTFQRPGLANKLRDQIKSFHGNLFEIIIVESTGNTSAAKNEGLKKARGKIVIFFDDDVEITKETIPNHIRAYSDAKIVGVAGRVINDGEKIPSKTDVDTGKTNLLGTKFSYKFWSTKKQPVDFVYGCNMSFLKSALQKIDGFDENFPKIFEEVDLSLRVRKLGKIIFEPQALVYHHKAAVGGIRAEEVKNKQKLIFANYGKYLAKNIFFPYSLFSLLLRSRTAIKDSPSTLSSLLTGYFKHFIRSTSTLLILIFILAILSRFWKLREFFTFNFDEEYQVLLAWEQVKNFHPVWIGVSASNVNYYLGPGVTYLTALLLFISKDPLILALFGSALGVTTAVSIYYVTKNVFSQQAALYAFAFYSGSLFLNFFDRRYWSATPIAFFSIWMLFLLYKTASNQRWLILAFLFMGLALHIHLSLLAFWPVVIYVIWLCRKKIKLSTYLVSLITFFSATLPLFIFDLNHNFDNLSMPVRLLKKFLGEQSSANTASTFLQLLNSLSRIWFIKPFSNFQDELQLGIHGNITNTYIPLSIFSLIILSWFLFKSVTTSRYRILALTYLSFLIVYLFYPGGVVAYFLLGFLTLFAVNIGLFFSNLPSRTGVTILAIFALFNLYSLITLRQERFGLLTRKKLIQKIMPAVNKNSFYLETRTRDNRKYHSAGGWRYLFKAYGKTPEQSHADQFFGWIYQDEISNTVPKYRVIVSEYPTKVNQPVLKQFSSGVYFGYIVNNEAIKQ